MLPSLDTFPQNGYYRAIIAGSPQPVNIAGRNLGFMYEGYIRAKEEYLRVFTTEMRARLGGLMSTLLAVQLANEAYLYHTEAPFHQCSGTVSVAGRSYDMAVPAQRQAAADAAFVAYADRGVAAVKAVDPELMVTMGAFTNLAVNGKAFDGLSGLCAGKPCGEPRYPVRVSAVTRESDLDFFDIHLYLMTGRTLQAQLNSMEWSQVTGPVINGEYGSQRRWFDGDIQRARTALVAHQVGTCDYGISGWLYWTWDTTEEAGQQSFFNGVESGGLLGAALSPRNRPDPCSTTEVRVRHLTVAPLSAAERDGSRPRFTGGGPSGTVTLTVNGQEAGRVEATGWRWELVPTRDLPMGEPFDAVFRQYRDGRLSDIVTVPDSSSLDLGTGMTLEAWVKPTASGWRSVLLKERPSGLSYALYSSADTNRPTAEIKASSSITRRNGLLLRWRMTSEIGTPPWLILPWIVRRRSSR